MLRIILAVTFLLGLAGGAHAACNVPNPNLLAGDGTHPFIDNCPLPAVAMNKLISGSVVPLTVVSPAALRATSTAAATSFVGGGTILMLPTIGATGVPVPYTPLTGTCATNGFTDDGWSCLNTTTGDGNSWHAQSFSAGPVRAPISVFNPLFNSALAGQDGACQFWVGTGLTATPSLGDSVDCTFYIDDAVPRNGQSLWGSDFVVAQTSPTADGVVHGIEVEFSAGISAPNNPILDTPTHGKIGVDVVAQPFAVAGAHPSTYFRSYSPDATGAYTPWAGLALSRVHDYGIYLDDLGDSNTFTFSRASFYDNTQSPSVISLAKAHQQFLDLSNVGADFTSFIKGFSTTATNLTIANAADFPVQFGLNSGTTAAQNASIDFYDRATLKWQLQKNAANGFGLIDTLNSITAWFVDSSLKTFVVNEVNGIAALKYSAGATPGVSCTGTPSSSFATINGIVTHC